MCEGCGGVVGVRGAYEEGVIARKLEVALKKVAQAMNVHVDLDS